MSSCTIFSHVYDIVTSQEIVIWLVWICKEKDASSVFTALFKTFKMHWTKKTPNPHPRTNKRLAIAITVT